MKMHSIKLHENDNVSIVISEEGVTGADGLLIPWGHKISTRVMQAGEPILKFGHAIGTALREIPLGTHVHVHNVDPHPPQFFGAESQFQPHQALLTSNMSALPAEFQGYRRPNGQVGVRNYIAVVGSVNCSATVVKAICRRFEDPALLQKFGVDGVVPVTHGSGCAQAIGGLSYTVLNRTLAGWVFHPNVVGALVIGLGCEGTTLESILEEHARAKHAHAPFLGKSGFKLTGFKIQDAGGTQAAIEKGIQCVQEIGEGLPKFQRESCSVSALTIALNCGGSDAFSSLTANPTLGAASDLLVERGGSVALAEIPECHGAEDLLLRRACDEGVRSKLKGVFDWWDRYARSNSVELNNNLSPGNIQGGITTITEKSLGAVMKGGLSSLKGVYDYSEFMDQKGFLLMNTPGFDPVSVTGLVAGGAQVVAFTTGRGSVYGCSIAPTLKIATNHSLFTRMRGDMDFDASKAFEGASMSAVGADLYQVLIRVASGEPTCSETLRVGAEEFVPWAVGETL